jgi:hypothetical protein
MHPQSRPPRRPQPAGPDRAQFLASLSPPSGQIARPGVVTKRHLTSASDSTELVADSVEPTPIEPGHVRLEYCQVRNLNRRWTQMNADDTGN